jgi:DNA repair exonuclease SbcCD nuclease subunit
VRVAAIGDAHLGRSALGFTTSEGVNQREADFERSFRAAVEAALAARPDLVVWLGDIFDHPRPTYRSFRVAQWGLARIREHGLRAVVISGNHDTPRLTGTGSPYSALADAFPEMHFAPGFEYKRIELDGLVVHAVPQMGGVEATLEALDQAYASRSLDSTNLLITHPRLHQVQPKYADINEVEVDATKVRSDLVLLGHYHNHIRVAEGMWYAGATDSFSFADEPERPKGLVVLDTDTGECTHLPLEPSRALVTLDTLQARGLGPKELQEALERRVSQLPEGAVGRLFVEGADPDSWRLVDLSALRRAWAPALYCKLEPSFSRASAPVELPDMDSMQARWSRYLQGQDLTGYDRARIDQMGQEYISQAVEQAG